jgi:hypothetical protein
MRMRVRARLRVCERVRVCVSVRARVCVLLLTLWSHCQQNHDSLVAYHKAASASGGLAEKSGSVQTWR